MTYDFATCRSVGHQWQVLSIEKAGTVTVTRQCSECQTTSVTRFARASGILVNRRYSWPTGYKSAKSRAQHRKELFR